MSNPSYRFIENIPALAWTKLESKELQSLSATWREQRIKLKSSEALKEFNQKLAREWAIETGIIENLYTLDRGTTKLFIERGFKESLISSEGNNKNPLQMVSLIKDQETALEGLFAFVKNERSLSTSYIKALHQTMTRNQKTGEAMAPFGNLGEVQFLRGEWKKLPNNPTRPDGLEHQYCPPEQVSSEMDQLILMYQENLKQEMPTELLAAWLHHRFTQIHPFQDGNGRMARALASLVFIQKQWFPLVVDRDIRLDYIRALEQADDGEMKPLVMLFTKIQKKAFLKALNLSEKTLKAHDSLHDLIDSSIEKIKERREANIEQVSKAGELLQRIIESKLSQVSSLLSNTKENLSSHVDKSGEHDDFWFHSQIVDTAKELDYFADTRTYRKWMRLKIFEEGSTEIVFSIHSFGTHFAGLLAVSCFISFKNKEEEKNTYPPASSVTACPEVFQFSHKESHEKEGFIERDNLLNNKGYP